MSKQNLSRDINSIQTTQDANKFKEDMLKFESALNQEFGEWRVKNRKVDKAEFTPSFELIRDLKTYVRESDYVLHVRSLFLLILS